MPRTRCKQGAHREAPPSPLKDGVKMGGTHTEAPPLGGAKTNTGASSMITSESRGCINIYINNNIQGVNHSLLFGSHVRLGDPGIRISINGLTFQTQQPPNQNKIKNKKKMMKKKMKKKKLMRKSSLWSTLVLVSASTVIASFFTFSLFTFHL